MLKILMEDTHILVVEKPPGMESQTSRGFEPDMVSEIKRHLHKLSPTGREPYVAVIHRLDKPVGGVMVYAKTTFAAAALSKQLQNGGIQKWYQAVVCGKPVDEAGTFVDNLLKNGKTNYTQVVDKGITGGKTATLHYRLLQSLTVEQTVYSLLEIQLVTGRHHQIRVQMAAHGLPLLGDQKYNEACQGSHGLSQLALWAVGLRFPHPKTGEILTFHCQPQGQGFAYFQAGQGTNNG